MAVALVVPPLAVAQSDSKIDLTALVARAAPGAGHEALQPLVGRWRVTKSNFVIGTAERPITSEDMITERQWIADGRFISETTTGTLGGRPYFRRGVLGYNSMDKRYEWTTADNQTPIMMTYHGANGSGVGGMIDMRGSFTDLGVTGEQNVGKAVMMRTRIRIIDKDHHMYDLYFTPPGKAEMLADRMIFDRIK